MKRMHIHLSVSSIEASVAFYSKLFGQTPSVQHSDYAKWMLDDPRVNFAISTRSASPGLDHLGIQVESVEELNAMRAQLTAADVAYVDQGTTTCCYAQSDKGWIYDPQGVAWESFYTHGSATSYGVDTPTRAADAGGTSTALGSACCAPSASTASAAANACCAPNLSTHAVPKPKSKSACCT